MQKYIVIPRRILLIVPLVVISFGIQACFALDWKKLHERADKSDLADAFSASSRLPVSIDDLYVLGLVNLNLHKDKEAGEVFQKIIKLDPKNLGAEWGLAELKRREHKLEESTNALSDIIKMDRVFYPAYISLAYIKYTQNSGIPES